MGSGGQAKATRERCEEPGDREIATATHHRRHKVMTMKCIARGGTCTARKACATRATRARVATHSRVSSNVACRAARGTYNTDYAGVEDFMRHEKDVGSSEYENQTVDRAPEGAQDRPRDQEGADELAEQEEHAPEVFVQQRQEDVHGYY